MATTKDCEEMNFESPVNSNALEDYIEVSLML